MSKPILYSLFLGPPTRSVLMTAKELGLELDLKPVDFIGLEHMKPEFLKLNPAHTIPVLVDGAITICDSHSIITYLVDKYGKNDKLYPKDLDQRSMVNTKLIFEAIMYERHRSILFPILFKGRSNIPDDKKELVEDVYEQLELGLRNNLYMVGNNLTIADLSIITTIPSLRFFHEIYQKKYPHLLDWIKRMEQLSYYDEINRRGSDILIEKAKTKLEENKMIGVM